MVFNGLEMECVTKCKGLKTRKLVHLKWFQWIPGLEPENLIAGV